MKEKKIKIAIVDDHQIIIDGLIALLKEHPLIEIVATENDGEKMLQLLQNKAVDILLTDVMMPGLNGIQLAKAVKVNFPSIKIIALSMSGQADVVEQMINESAIAGFMLKQTNATELANAIAKVYNGGACFQEDVLKELALYADMRQDIFSTRITNREKQLIALIEKDLSNKDIAAALFISTHTVETHRKNIFRKTGTNSVLTLVKWAYEHKILIPKT